MACKCSDCPEVGCRLNRLNMATQENVESAQHNHQQLKAKISEDLDKLIYCAPRIDEWIKLTAKDIKEALQKLSAI